jgi:hypothetical protein
MQFSVFESGTLVLLDSRSGQAEQTVPQERKDLHTGRNRIPHAAEK